MPQLASLNIDHVEKQKDAYQNMKGLGLETRDFGVALWT